MTTRLSVTEAADRAGVSESLVYRWCDEGRLAHYRLGSRGRRGKIVILATDLDAFLESCRVTDAAGEDGPLKHIR
jgi:excisionase family DNA binding protein